MRVPANKWEDRARRIWGVLMLTPALGFAFTAGWVLGVAAGYTGQEVVRAVSRKGKRGK